MRTRHFILTVFALILFQTAAFSQEIDDYVTTGSPAGWVKQQDFRGKDVIKPDTRYLLVDKQIHVSQTDEEWYFRYVEQFNTPKNVQDGSTISIVLDPEYETVQLHHLRLIRDGNTQDLLDLSQFDFYRLETDRDKFIYDGKMQMSYHVPGVRVGDILDYAYTYAGKNPALGQHFSTQFSHGYAVDVDRLYNRFLVENDVPVFYKSLGGAIEPEITEFDTRTEYTWLLEPAAKKIVEDNTPPSYVGWPRTDFSSFEDWAAVGKFFATYYQLEAPPSKEITEIANEIRENTGTKSAQLRAAVTFVQREIRYLGIELGAGGYIPRAPDTVLARRFGDCKDMSLLLIAILDILDIKAVPLLVDHNLKGAVADRLPSSWAFDHVIVAASLNGKTYFLDPTRGEQLGDLDHMQQGDFGKGVIIASDSPGMIDAAAPQPKFFRSVTDVFDFRQSPDDVSLTREVNLFMKNADQVWISYRNGTLDEIEKSVLKRFQKRFQGLEQTTPMSIAIDQENAKVTLTAGYTITDAWKENDDPNWQHFTTYAQDLYWDSPAYLGGTRTAPLEILHPTKSEHTIRFLLEGPWDLQPESVSYKQPAFEFQKKSLYLNDIYTNVFKFETKSDQISAADFRATMADIKKLDKAVDVGIERHVRSKD